MTGLVAASLSTTLLLNLAAPAAGAAGRRTGGKPRVVVAVVDTGINPYHEYFHGGGPLYKQAKPSSVTPAVLREFGIDKDHIIKVTRTGDFAADFAKDRAQFEDIDKGEPYWFKGTNVIGISFEEGPKLRPDGNESAHGIGTAAAVLGANRDAVVVAVEGINSDSEKWAMTFPAVDIITTSYGPPTSVPTLDHLSSSYTGVVENGKAHFGAAANDPSYSTFDETSGPWWTIGIAGFEEGSSNGRQALSGNVPDFVGDFTQDLPYCRSCETGTREVRGTSFATPRSAGTFSKILLEARNAARHLGGIVKKGKKRLLVTGKHSFTVWEARRALEEAAWYPGSQQSYRPDPTAPPVVDAAPWYQMGWGLISPAKAFRVIHETLAHLGVEGKARRTKPEDACEFMTTNMQVRRTYWEQVAVLGESFHKSRDPYIYC